MVMQAITFQITLSHVQYIKTSNGKYYIEYIFKILFFRLYDSLVMPSKHKCSCNKKPCITKGLQHAFQYC